MRDLLFVGATLVGLATGGIIAEAADIPAAMPIKAPVAVPPPLT